jgi:hypothetical protein
MRAFRAIITAAAGCLLGFAPVAADACAVCFGQTDSPLGRGQQWGVLVLLGVVLIVLSSFGAFAVYLARRSRMLEQAGSEPHLLDARKG